MTPKCVSTLPALRRCPYPGSHSTAPGLARKLAARSLAASKKRYSGILPSYILSAGIHALAAGRIRSLGEQLCNVGRGAQNGQ